MTSLNLVLIASAVFLFLTAKCLAIYIGMRRQMSIAWLAAGLSCIVLILAPAYFFPASRVEEAAMLIMMPLAFLSLGQTARLMVGSRDWNRAATYACLVFTGLAVALFLLGFPAASTLPLSQFASVIALVETIARLTRYGRKDAMDHALFAGVSALLAIVLLRTPVELRAIGASGDYSLLRSSVEETKILTAFAIAGVATVTIFLMRIVGDVVSTLRRRTERDGLTNLLNHQKFRSIASIPSEVGGCVIYCDIDHFKSINDRFGHGVGDDVIRGFANLLHTVDCDAARLGGEEFGLIVQGFTVREAVEVADGLRSAFAATPLVGGEMASVSASFGVASFGAGEAPDVALPRADAALYAAKRGGRNRVEHWSNDGGAMGLRHATA